MVCKDRHRCAVFRASGPYTIRLLLLFFSLFAAISPFSSAFVTNNGRCRRISDLQQSTTSTEQDNAQNTTETNEVDSPQSLEERNLRFSGVGRLYTSPSGNKNAAALTDHLEVLDRLQASSVLVVGLGGVGSWAAEALCRSGVGHLTLMDLDDICISNTNRQLHALENSVGKMKIDVMKERLQQINPECNITLVHDFVSITNADELLRNLNPTVCLDAIDGAKSKTALIAACARQRIPIVTCGGSAGRMDPTRFVVEDLTRVTGDSLLSSCRRELRREYGFEEGVRFKSSDPAKNRGGKLPKKWNIQAIYSKEPQKSLPGGSDASSLRQCDGALGTACFVTGTSGFLAAGRVVDMTATNKLKPPRNFPGNVPLESEA